MASNESGTISGQSTNSPGILIELIAELKISWYRLTKSGDTEPIAIALFGDRRRKLKDHLIRDLEAGDDSAQVALDTLERNTIYLIIETESEAERLKTTLERLTGCHPDQRPEWVNGRLYETYDRSRVILECEIQERGWI